MPNASFEIELGSDVAGVVRGTADVVAHRQVVGGGQLHGLGGDDPRRVQQSHLQPFFLRTCKVQLSFMRSPGACLVTSTKILERRKLQKSLLVTSERY